MKEIIPSYIYLNIPFIIVLLIAAITGMVTYFYYRRTIPPVSLGFRIFLGISRGTAVFLILLLLFSPQLKLLWQNVLKTKIIVAVDNSASMTIKDKNIARYKNASAIVKYLNNELILDFDLKTYAFDIDTSSFVQDSLVAGKLSTNIDLSLTKILRKHKNTDAVIMVSDGNITDGSNPIFSNQLKKTKIFAIGIGDTSDLPDVLIKSIKSNKYVYNNTPTTITAEITSHSLGEFSTTVQLKHKNKIIAAKKVNLKQDGSIQPIQFEIIPDELGILKYEIEVTGFEAEELKENNKSNIFLEVLKNKLNVAVIASQPGYDVKFLKQMLVRNPDFNPQIYINQNIGQYDMRRITSILDSADVLILNDFPVKNVAGSIFKALISTIEKRRIPIIFFVSGREKAFSDKILKIKFPDISWQKSQQFFNVFAVPTISGKLNPVLNVLDSDELNNLFWQNCSPLEYPFQNVKIGDRDKIILKSKNNESMQPILLINNSTGTNNVIFLGAGYWRWKFLFAEDRQFQNAWSTFINNLIRWLSKSPGSQNVNISVKDKVVSLGEQLNLETQLYDGSFNPVLDGQVRLKVSSSTGEFETETKHEGNGIYSWQYTPFAEGKYQITVIASKNDVPLGEAQIEINVVPVNKEFIYTKQDKDFLQKLAQSTGGLYFTTDNYQQIKNVLPKTNKIQDQTKTYELWNKLPMLLLIILLLTIEWYFRKRKGLA